MQRFSVEVEQILHSAPFGFTVGLIRGGGVGGSVDVELTVVLVAASAGTLSCNILNCGIAAISKSISRAE